MIKLYQFPPVWNLPSASPFCMKLETYLRMAELPYENAPGADVRKAPKRKLPYIEDAGRTIADSGFIVAYLSTRYGDKLDAALSPAERAQALALRRLMEEHLYWPLAYARWIEPENWRVTKRAYFGFMPPVLRVVIPELIRKGVIRDFYGHGMGRHSVAEIYELGCRDISALSDYLDDKPFFMGREPTSLDATAYAWIANIVVPPLASPLKTHAQSLPNLTAYIERMRTRYFARASALPL